MLNVNTTKKTPPELLCLEDVVLTPSHLADIKDVPRGLIEWDAACRTFIEAGGHPLSEHRKV